MEISKALIYLSLFNDEQINDIVGFIRVNGSNAASVVNANRKRLMLPPPTLAEIDCEVASPEDVRSMSHAITLILFDAFNKDWAEASYAALLVTALGMSDKQAAKVAARIDTEDVFTWSKADWTDRMKRVYNFLVPNFMESEYNSKGMDKDFKYELKLFGDAVTEIVKSSSFSAPRTFSALTPSEAYALKAGDITPSIVNKMSIARAAMRYIKDPFYGDVFSSILGGLKLLANVVPESSFVAGAANLAQSISDISSADTAKASGAALAAKTPVTAEFYPIQPSATANLKSSTSTTSTGAVPMVFLERDGFGVRPKK